jgi:hypothetical protein
MRKWFICVSHNLVCASIIMQEILQFFEKFIGSVSTDLQFVIDDLSTEDSSAVGVTWHLGMLKNYSMLFNPFHLI